MPIFIFKGTLYDDLCHLVKKRRWIPISRNRFNGIINLKLINRQFRLLANDFLFLSDKDKAFERSAQKIFQLAN
jgi:hypothetical protein